MDKPSRNWPTSRRITLVMLLLLSALALGACAQTDAVGNKFQVFFYEEPDGEQFPIAAMEVGTDGLVRAEYQAAGSEVWTNVSADVLWSARTADDVTYEPEDVLTIGAFDAVLGGVPVLAVAVPSGEDLGAVEVCAAFSGFDLQCVAIFVTEPEE